MNDCLSFKEISQQYSDGTNWTFAIFDINVVFIWSYQRDCFLFTNDYEVYFRGMFLLPLLLKYRLLLLMIYLKYLDFSQKSLAVNSHVCRTCWIEYVVFSLNHLTCWLILSKINMMDIMYVNLCSEAVFMLSESNTEVIMWFITAFYIKSLVSG